MTRDEVLDLIEEEDVEFIRLQFTDITGTLKNVAITASQIEHVLKHGCRFESFALADGLSELGEDLYLEPDLDTFVILPWRPQQGKVARFLCNVYREDGTLCMSSPRVILSKVLEEAKDKGYTFYVDPECEFFLYHTDEGGMPTTVTHDQAGYLDVGPVDLGENARRDMVLALEDMGFKVESSHHEKAPAQHEIDFRDSEAMECADSIMTFRNTVRSIAKRFGLHATFMPKPRQGVPGSGMHINITLYKDDRNIFNSKDSGVIRDEAKWFIGGILKHASAMCAITNPLVNSYKRLCSGFDAPLYKVWSTKKINPLICLKKPMGEETKIELRFPDSASNPYLVLATAIAAGLEGIENQIDPGAPVLAKADMPTEGKDKKMPITLIEAIDELNGDSLFRDKLGAEFMDEYKRIKTAEWDAYMAQVSQWEIDQYLYKI